MKLHLLALTTLLTLTTAQNLSGEPSCATACLSSAISKAGCAATDEGCQCGPTQAAIGGIAASCLIASCPATELAVIQSIGLALCAQYSAGLTMKTTTVPSTTATVTASSQASVTSSSAPLATSTSTTVAVSSTVITTTTAASVSSSVTAASSGSSTTSAPATVSSSAAMTLLVSGIGGLAALFFGVVATL